MHVNGIYPYVINGTMSMDARSRAVNDFIHSTDEGRRVLLFSSVGAAGLNLACADTVILYVRCDPYATSVLH
jgi:SNF2 family DNA or RNA helicase